MINLGLIFPEIFISLSIMLLLMIGVFKKNSGRLIYNLSTISLLILLALVINLFSVSETLIFNESYKIDSLSLFMKSLITIIAIFVMISLLIFITILTSVEKTFVKEIIVFTINKIRILRIFL